MQMDIATCLKRNKIVKISAKSPWKDGVPNRRSKTITLADMTWLSVYQKPGCDDLYSPPQQNLENRRHAWEKIVDASFTVGPLGIGRSMLTHVTPVIQTSFPWQSKTCLVLTNACNLVNAQNTKHKTLFIGIKSDLVCSSYTKKIIDTKHVWKVSIYSLFIKVWFAFEITQEAHHYEYIWVQ